VAAPCARLHFVREPVRSGDRGRPFYGIVRQRVGVVDIVKRSWGWIGIEPVEVVAMNSFGNLLIKDATNRYWRLCPEDLYCQIVAENDASLATLLKDPDFAEDWEMRELVRLAHKKLGPLENGRRYCLKIPGILGGAYDEQNLATIALGELISFSGHLAGQIKDLPEGSKIEFKFTE